MRMDLNADLGEGMPHDDSLLGIVTSANIATGAHAGGGSVLRRAVAAASELGVCIGAHPSYRDRAGFGRASMLAGLVVDRKARADFVEDLVDQVLQVAHEAHGHGRVLSHVKAHGALYNEAVRDRRAAQIVVEAIDAVVSRLGYPVAVMTQPGGELATQAADRGLTVITEGFADRGYSRDGRLVGREHPRALHAEVSAMVTQALDLARGRVVPVNGPSVELRVDSLCVHGDTEGAVQAARAIRLALQDGGWRVAAAHPARTRMMQAPAIMEFGDRALILEPAHRQHPGTSWVLEVAARARRAWPSATIVPGLASVLAVFDRPTARPHPRDPEVADLLGGIDARPPAASTGEAQPDASPWPQTSPRDLGGGSGRHEFLTEYGGADLAEVADLLGVPAQEVVRRHAAARWTVAAIGFSPGFGYLTCTDPLFREVTRRADPRTRVPPGSVALAAGMCAVYPSSTPGGWQLIGSTRAALFDVGAPRPARLAVGDRVEFVEVR